MARHKKLAHLTSEQVDDLVKRYNEGEKLASLIEAFNIDAKPAGLVHLLPPVVHEDLPCPYCPDTNLISKRPARTSVPATPNRPIVPAAGTGMLSGARANPAGPRPKPSAASPIKRNGRLLKPPVRASTTLRPLRAWHCRTPYS